MKNNYDLRILKFMQGDQAEFSNALNALGDLYLEAYRNQAEVKTQFGFKCGFIAISGILAGIISGIIITAAKQDGLVTVTVTVGVGVGCALILAYLCYRQCFDYSEKNNQFMFKIGDNPASKNIAESFWGADGSEKIPLLGDNEKSNVTRQELQNEFLKLCEAKG